MEKRCIHDDTDCDRLDIRVVHKDSTPKGKRFYVARPSALGNPYTYLPTKTLAKYKVATRDESIEKYREWIEERMYKDNPQMVEFGKLVEWMMTECYMELACWCAPQSCHADILRKLVLEDDWLYK